MKYNNENDNNALFQACVREQDPMYDVAVITEKEGIRHFRLSKSNSANNGHSTTKLIIATCIGMLEAQGKLSRYDKVTSFFDKTELPDTMDVLWNDVTVEQTMQHKTGIEDDPFCVDDDDAQQNIGDDFLKYVFSLKIMHTPGTFRRYSDEAYYLLGRIITKASGENCEAYIQNHLAKPLQFHQWATAKCPMGHMICGGGFYTRADDLAKLGYMYAGKGEFEGQRLLSESYCADAMQKDYACSQFRDTDVYLKTGAKGQCVAFSQKRKAAAAWHGCTEGDNGKRNDRLLEAFVRFLDETFIDE